MPLEFYKGNQSLKGCGAGFSVNSKEGTVYISLVQQSSWNPAKRLGSFAGAKTRLKFNINEIGAIIDSFNVNKELKLFHKNISNDTTNIVFAPYILPNRETNEPEQRGYGMKVCKTSAGKSVNWLFTIGFGEAVVIVEWLKFALEHCFSAIYSQDKKNFEARVKEKEQAQPQEAPSEEEVPQNNEDAPTGIEEFEL